MEHSPQSSSQTEGASVDENLERIYLRFAMVETDEQMQKFTNTYLVRLIEMAGLNASAVTKIREILSHYNRRAKAVATLKYPVETLTALLKHRSPVVVNLSLIYLRFAVDHLTEEEHLGLLPLLLDVLSSKVSEPSQSTEVLGLCMSPFLVLTQRDKHTWPKLPITPEVRLLLLRFFHCIVAFPVDQPDVIKTTCDSITNGEKNLTPAMTAEEYLMIANKVMLKNVSIVKIKLCALSLLVSEWYDDAAIFSILVLGSAQGIDAVTDVAEAALRKIDITACVDNRVVVSELMCDYLGTMSPTKPFIGKSSSASPANSLMKQKILQYLTRSAIAPVAYMDNMKVCLDGLAQTSFSKLLIAALNFLLKVIEKMPAAAQKNFSPILFDRVQKLLGEVKNNTALSLIYRCVGILGKRDISIVTKSTDLIALTFKSVAQAPDDVAYAVIDCLTQWLEGFRSLKDPTLMEKLKSLIQEFIAHENSKCRLIALKYMEAFLTSDEVDLRWMLLQSCGDSRDEIRSEAIRLLNVSLKVDVSVEAALSYLWAHLSGDIVDPESGKEKSPSAQQISPIIHQMTSLYLWAILARAAGVNVNVDDSCHEWSIISPKITPVIRRMSRQDQERLTRIALKALKDAQEAPLFNIAASFSNVCCVSTSSPSTITACLNQTRGTTRSEMAQVAAHLAATLMSAKERESATAAAFAAIDMVNVTAGNCWLASAFIAAHGNSRTTVISTINRLLNIADEGYNKPNNVLESVLGALANIMRTILHHDKDFELPPETLSRYISVCEKIAVSRKDAVSTKAHEEATHAIGFCATTLDSELFDKLTSALYAIGSGPPQPELQLIVGSALYDVALGPYSNSRRNLYSSSEEEFQLSSVPDTDRDNCEAHLGLILSKIFERLTSMNHHERRAALIWLLVIVRRGFKARIGLLQTMLDKIQSAFGMGLSENDDFTQDVASSGIGLVYEMATAEQRSALVNDLIANISEGKSFSAKVDSNTEIFSKEQQIVGPDGQHLSTYKELCSLATDLNQPDLVYKFMNLARHNSLWNSKKGAALGFAIVLEEASSELDPFISKLVPKLFRYRYDPDLKVRQSMRSIWTVLTASRRGLVEEYVDDIAKELQEQLTKPEWRVRESSCLALSDLIQGNDSRYIRSIVPDLLLTIFRLRDDVKESVRLAANRAVGSLGKLAVRLSAESSKGNDPKIFLSSLLPVLIKHGIQSEIKINKQFSISLLIELSKNAGAQLRPHLAELIPSLIDTISDAEPAVLNYLAARSTLAELEMLDDARAQMARTSPMMLCQLLQIDSSVLVAMQPRLCEQLRSSAGASTRTACAQLLTVLSLRAPQLLRDHQPQCDKLFNALIAGTRDRNPSVRKQFASAVSYLAKFVSPTSFEALMKTVLKDLVADDESMKQSAKHVLKSLSANCSELLQGYSKLVIPYVFLETCQTVVRGDEASKKRREEWCDLWNEIVPSTEAAVRMYNAEIIAFIIDILQNNDIWSVRAQAARMLTETVGHLQDRMSGADAASLLSFIMPMLSGRIWPGKENLVTAVAAVFSCAGPSLRAVWTEKETEEVFGILCREASKKKMEYAAAGLLATSAFAQALPYPKAVEWLVEKVADNVRKALDPSEDDDEQEEEDNSTREARIAEFMVQNMISLVKAIGAYSKGEDASVAIGALCVYLGNDRLFWKAKQALVTTLLELSSSWQPQSVINVTTLIEALLMAAEEMVNQQRKSIAMQCLSVISKLAQRKDAFTVHWDELKKKFETSRVVQESGMFDDLESLTLITANSDTQK
ncbi:hypothetical protein Q1695_013850 [Nippostrongylus brasiliensis]|nr:hypothetical protein Q1695_013850 [Nippostrongylus brasiliensis]